MQKRIIEGVEVQRSSGNVFADLGLPDAEKLKIKTGLVVEIRRAMRALGLTQQAAAKRMGIPQPKVSGMMRGDFTNLSERKLMDCLNRLGYDIEIKVRPAAEPIGQSISLRSDRLVKSPRIMPDTFGCGMPMRLAAAC
jgi:predicted XRE-type DNA-binding protein